MTSSESQSWSLSNSGAKPEAFPELEDSRVHITRKERERRELVKYIGGGRPYVY